MSGARPYNSPCTDVCAIDDDTGWCIGCARTMSEIATWATMGDPARTKIFAELDTRKPKIANREQRAKRLRRSPY